MIGLLITLAVVYSHEQPLTFLEFSRAVGYGLIGSAGAWTIAMFICMLAAPFQIHLQDFGDFEKEKTELIQQVKAVVDERNELRVKMEQKESAKDRVLGVALDQAHELFSRRCDRQDQLATFHEDFGRFERVTCFAIKDNISDLAASRFRCTTGKHREEVHSQRRHGDGNHYDALVKLADYIDNLNDLVRDFG